MMFFVVITLTLNKSVRLIGHLPMGDIFTLPCLLWDVFYEKPTVMEE